MEVLYQTIVMVSIILFITEAVFQIMGMIITIHFLTGHLFWVDMIMHSTTQFTMELI